MITPANPAALLVPDDETAIDYKVADSRARLRIAAGVGLLALGFGLAGWALIAGALVAAIALLVITAAGLIAIITGSTRRVDLGNRRRHDETQLRHDELRDAVAQLSGRMITEFGDLHREIRLIEQRQNAMDHRQDKNDSKVENLERVLALTTSDLSERHADLEEEIAKIRLWQQRAEGAANGSIVSLRSVRDDHG